MERITTEFAKIHLTAIRLLNLIKCVARRSAFSAAHLFISLRYLHDFNIPIAPPYGSITQLENGQFEFTGEHNTGCKLCLFGCHLEHEPNRIQRLANIEPNTYKFIMKSREEGGLGYREVMDYLGIPYETPN